MFEMVENLPQNAIIKVIGVGGGGGNAVEHMHASNVDGVEFICANTDAQALQGMSSQTLIQLGGRVTKGLGAGANPDIGKESAIEDKDRIREVLQGADMVFITAGMGGGTGTGGAPVIAQIAKELGILTVAVVTKPFPFEGKKRTAIAQQGVQNLSEYVDSLITIPNERLLEVLGANTSLLDAFKAANDVLLGAVQGIADLIIRPGMINVDFADVKTVMSEMGMAMMGTGNATGESRAKEAAEAAIKSPLLDNVNLEGAKGILVNITANESLSLGEFTEVGDIVEEFASDAATVVVGTVIDPSIGDELKVTVVATGLNAEMGVARRTERLNAQAFNNQPVQAKLVNQQPVDYKQFEVPTATRLKEKEDLEEQKKESDAQKELELEGQNADYLDIPTFLRKQSD